MIRLVLLSLLTVSASAFAQTADVIQVVTEGGGNPVKDLTVSTVTYDLTKIVKGNPDLNTTDKVLKRLTAYGAVRESWDAVTTLPKNRITVRANLATHDEIQRELNAWAVKPTPAPPELPVVRAPKPAGLLPPPGGLGGVLDDDIRRKLLGLSDKKKR